MEREELESFYKHRMDVLGLNIKEYPCPSIEYYDVEYICAYTAMLAEREHC